MSVKIRLKRMGTKKKPHNKIVICDSRKARNSKSIEEIGFHDPTQNPPLIQLNKERALYWLKVGAQPTEAVKSIFKRQGIR